MLLAAIIVVGIAVIVIIIALAVDVAERNAKPPRCPDSPTSADAREHIAILEQHPPEAVEVDRIGGCRDDGSFAFAELEYEFAGKREDVARFYRGVARQAGWSLAVDVPSPSPPKPLTAERVNSLCFTKRVAGRTASLALTFKADLRSGSTSDYWWTLRVDGSC